MADGKFIVGTGGKFQVNADGRFDACEECCGCLPEVQLTLSGFDGNHCAGCIASGGASKIYTGSAGIDGTYAVPFLAENGPDRCTYAITFQDLGSTVNQSVYTGTTCGTLLHSKVENEIQIVVDLWRRTLGVRTVSVITGVGVGGLNVDASNIFEVSISATPGYAIGSPISNQLICSPPNNPGTGFARAGFFNSHSVGTAQVDI